jgi:hypothetical protein
MQVYEEEIELPAIEGHRGLLRYLGETVRARLGNGLLPVRFVITAMDEKRYRCELGVIEGLLADEIGHSCSIFDFRQRSAENCSAFNAVMLVPTGIGSEIGGHAGDANTVATLLASVCDTLITHPNVLNASDLNELPANGLYVEGSIITRLLMGISGLQPVRANRVLVIMDQHPDHLFNDIAINSVNSARATFGLECPAIVALDPPVGLRSLYAASGRAAGRVDHFERVTGVLDEYRGRFDALAITTQIAMPERYHRDYYEQEGEMVNPWGGVEAIFTHAISSLYDIPAAHAPMDTSRELANLDLGVVDARMAAEIISEGYFSCVLKGLQHSPHIVKDLRFGAPAGALTAADVSCLVIPDKAVGLPTLAALEQGIPVIAVRENRNIMNNDLLALPWADGQLHMVDNYWEAAGVMAALRAGIAPSSVRRPLETKQRLVKQTD